MSHKKAEKAHLIAAPPSKKRNTKHKKFNPHRRNNPINTHNTSNYEMAQSKVLKDWNHVTSVNGRVTTG